MSDLLRRLLSDKGKTEADISPRSGLGKLMLRRGVRFSPEIPRIVDHPRTDLCGLPSGDEMAKLLTEAYRSPQGKMALRPIQAECLQALHDFGGLLAMVRVGGGKTLVSYLAAEVVGAERPLLIVPAKLVTKTTNDFKELSRHWKVSVAPRVVSYEKISVDYEGELFRDKPDLIIADEAQKLKNLRAGVTKRVKQYIEHAEHRVRFAALSGTLTTRSIREYWHLAHWAFGDHMPLPKRFDIMKEWADCIDVVKDGDNLHPGELELLVEKFGSIPQFMLNPVQETRLSYQKRLKTWPGVVGSSETMLSVPLMIRSVDVEVSGGIMDDAWSKLRRDWETPDGHPFSEAVDQWRHARELAMGFYYVWDPRPPAEWLEARKAWKAYVRKALSGPWGFKTELEVTRHVVSTGGVREYAAWTAIREVFSPNQCPVWVHDSMLRYAASWLEATGGIAWTEHVAFGERLAALTGLPYFGSEGRCRVTGRNIEDPSVRGPIIASIASNGEGRNLQTRWSKNLVASAPPNGAVWEQMLGRTHRDGQTAEEVTFDVVVSCLEAWQGMQQVLTDAEYIQDTTGVPQKVLYADISLPDEVEVATYKGSRWNRY